MRCASGSTVPWTAWPRLSEPRGSAMSEPTGPDSPCPSWQRLKEELQSRQSSAWLPVLREDQHLRWKQGHRVPAESYLNHLAGLAIDEEMAIDLIYSEILLRIELGEK